MKMKRFIISIIAIITIITTVILLYVAYERYAQYIAVKQENDRQAAIIANILDLRKQEAAGSELDPFGDDNLVRILFIGLDSRAGQENGHCDAIQLIELDKAAETVHITAVPRGTYAPLPTGTGTTSSDYYVSNSCAIGGLDYGITNIERILGKKSDFIVVVGFSETLGILRHINLPTTETLQWLRHRQGYAIGEPQRARNHSTFIKQMLVRFLPEKISGADKALHYILYNKIQTNLSFSQSEQIISSLVDMNIAQQPEKITLAMKPQYNVEDIKYNPENISEHLASTIGRYEQWLGSDTYLGKSVTEIQDDLITMIELSKNDPKFVSWAYDNDLWLQIEDDLTRENTRWQLLTLYIETRAEDIQKAILADYILEMEHMGEIEREIQAKTLLLEMFPL